MSFHLVLLQEKYHSVAFSTDLSSAFYLLQFSENFSMWKMSSSLHLLKRELTLLSSCCCFSDCATAETVS